MHNGSGMSYALLHNYDVIMLVACCHAHSDHKAKSLQQEQRTEVVNTVTKS